MNNCVFTHWVAGPDSLLTNFLKKYSGHSFKEDFESYKPNARAGFSLYLFPRKKNLFIYIPYLSEK